jgi:organic hydroperoxide reductase OsmC/OhrA
MSKEHLYPLKITWTGNSGVGTVKYDAYTRNFTIENEKKEILHCSADAPFLGDNTKYNPEDMMVASISSCHMLWYLHLCADAGIIVTSYTDDAVGVLHLPDSGSGYITEVTLHPIVIITDETKIEQAIALHHKANEKCFIANSVKFPVYHKVTCSISK